MTVAGQPDGREHDARRRGQRHDHDQHVGNEPENNVALIDHHVHGPDGHRPRPVSLVPGQSTTETITLTPDASTPLNSMLQATAHRDASARRPRR